MQQHRPAHPPLSPDELAILDALTAMHEYRGRWPRPFDVAIVAGLPDGGGVAAIRTLVGRGYVTSRTGWWREGISITTTGATERRRVHEARAARAAAAPFN